VAVDTTLRSMESEIDRAEASQPKPMAENWRQRDGGEPGREGLGGVDDPDLAGQQVGGEGGE
jgi:hypothetical protein